jgi:hypothetical protein
VANAEPNDHLSPTVLQRLERTHTKRAGISPRPHDITYGAADYGSAKLNVATTDFMPLRVVTEVPGTGPVAPRKGPVMLLFGTW